MATVLVIDDEKVIREGLRRLLSADGHRVLTAENGQEGLKIIASEHLDVILCDLKMPVMGAARILEQVNSIPVIIITGEGTLSNAVDCMDKGAYDFVTKPFRTEELIRVVHHAIEGLPRPARSRGHLD